MSHKIVQIMPADQWNVFYEDTKDGKLRSFKPIAIALVECADGYRDIELIHPDDMTFVDRGGAHHVAVLHDSEARETEPMAAVRDIASGLRDARVRRSRD